jgi:hypothetical protein
MIHLFSRKMLIARYELQIVGFGGGGGGEVGM